MGIPSYFSHLMKRQRHIIRTIPRTNKKQKFDSLYMDCNSVVYDSYYARAKDTTTPLSEAIIISETLSRIKQIISHISPRNVIYIAFDGVAPVAKMEQQRSRRYKSWLLTKIGVDKPQPWNTSSITPGTEFMTKLMARVKDTFCQKNPRGMCIISLYLGQMNQARVSINCFHIYAHMQAPTKSQYMVWMRI